MPFHLAIFIFLSQAIQCATHMLQDVSARIHSQAGEEANVPDTEMAALYDFYTALKGPDWNWYNTDAFGKHWNFSDPKANPCLDLWQGITCLPPTSPYQFRYISQLNLVDFNLRGTLPDSIGAFEELRRLILPTNHITGTLPASLANISVLAVIELNNNNISGTIPYSWHTWTDIQVMYLDYNSIEGTIPEFIGTLHSLNYFDIGSNLLTGPIPYSMGDLSELAGIDVSFNRLTGTIPASFAQLTRLKVMYINDNFLHGPLPALAQMSAMQLLDADFNHLTGTISEGIGNLTRLHYIYLDHNFLSGTIPAVVGNLPLLEYLTLNTNNLHGSIPSTLADLPSLRVLLLYENDLTGSLDGIFNPATQLLLETIQVNDNELTGTLPNELFLLPQLNSLVAVSNCIKSIIPTTVCNSSRLVSLVLDGLHSAKSCRNPIFPRLSGSAYLVPDTDNSIPDCLYALPNLTTLHLSGNGFTGSLPDVTMTPVLVDLSLSHNRLTGNIPSAFQLRKWYNLDLSYNRLSGTLSSQFESQQVDLAYYTVAQAASNANFSGTTGTSNITRHTLAPTLSLENNRLSGRIPEALLSMQAISVLGSNVFSCNLEGTNLPRHDSGKNNYQCASDSFDIPYYVWLTLMCMSFAVLWMLWQGWFNCVSANTQDSYTVNYAVKRMKHWLYFSYDDPSVKAGLFVFNQMMDIICTATFRSMVYTIMVLLPLFALISYFYGRLTHPYAWTVSAAFLTGSVALALELPLLLGLVVLLLAVFVSQIAMVKRETTEGTRVFSVIARRKVPLLRKVGLYTLFVLANIVVVVGVNVGYVYIAIYESSTFLTFAQVMLSLFKIVWNNICTSNMLRSSTMYTTEGDTQYAETEFASLQVFVTLLNNIVIPCLVVVVISPSCFYNVFVAAPAVETPYTYDFCFLTDQDGDCVIYLPTLSSATYHPPFIYNYQCSSSLITYYAPAFVILCIVRAFATPVLQFALYHLHRRADSASMWYKLLDAIIPPILRPIAADQSLHERESDHSVQIYSFFDATRVLITMLSYLGLLLTFGAVFPPLAVALAVTVFVIAFTTKLGLGRFLSIANEQNLYRYLDVIERECRAVASVYLLQNSMWMLVTVSCWFYTLCLFDTLGDAVGFDGAYWVLIVMPLMPLVLYGWYRLYRRNSALTATESAAIDSKTNDAESGDTFNVMRDSVVELTIATK